MCARRNAAWKQMTTQPARPVSCSLERRNAWALSYPWAESQPHDLDHLAPWNVPDFTKQNKTPAWRFTPSRKMSALIWAAPSRLEGLWEETGVIINQSSITLRPHKLKFLRRCSYSTPVSPHTSVPVMVTKSRCWEAIANRCWSNECVEAGATGHRKDKQVSTLHHLWHHPSRCQAETACIQMASNPAMRDSRLYQHAPRWCQPLESEKDW